jgi:hypothetical protein
MTQFRLPDWLGGHDVAEVLRENGDGVYVRLARGERLALKRDLLVEIRPPSIDDPVDLPLILEETHDEYELKIWTATRSDQAAEIRVASRSRGLTAEQCRDAARALWKLGIEPQSGPIGNRHMGQPQGPVAVQRPGRGAS